MTRSTLKQHFKITPRGPFSLAASTAFLYSFAPAAHKASQASNHLHFAFVVDGSDQAVGVCLSEEKDTVVGEIFGETDIPTVSKQVERIPLP